MKPRPGCPRCGSKCGVEDCRICAGLALCTPCTRCTGKAS